MAKRCPMTGERVIYLVCQECTDKVCRNPQVTILPKKAEQTNNVSVNSNTTTEHVKETQKECEKACGKHPDCSTCFNRLEEYYDRMFGNTVKVTRCKVLTNQLIFSGQVAMVGCDYHNRDMSNEKICLNCEYYLGGGDWGLSCREDYYKVPGPVSEACEKFKRREEDVNACAEYRS